MHRIIAITNQTVPMVVARGFSSNAAATAALDSVLSKSHIEKSVQDELLIQRSTSTKAVHIQLNRPKKLNALSFIQAKYLSQLFPRIQHAPLGACSAIILTGAGDKAFCAGRYIF